MGDWPFPQGSARTRACADLILGIGLPIRGWTRQRALEKAGPHRADPALMTLRSVADSVLGLSRFRAAPSFGEKLEPGISLVGRGLLLLTVVLGLLMSRPEVPQFCFRAAMAVILIGMVEGLVRIESPSRAVAMRGRIFAAILFVVGGAVYLFLLIQAPKSKLVLAILSGVVLLGFAAARAGAEFGVAWRRERQTKV